MNIKKDGFYTYDEMFDSIYELKREYPDLVSVESVGKSYEGRDIPLLIVTKPGVRHNQKPAFYVQANVHSNEVQGTTVCLLLANELCSTYEEMLNDLAFYIIPRVNPDGAESALTLKYVPRSRNKVRYIKNHIIPQDVNGDGIILKMRIKCDDGNMKPSEIDSRVMVPRKKDDTEGPFYKVFTEGYVHEPDGGKVHNEKPEMVDFNRNYPVNWPYDNPLSGKYPFSEPETKAIGDFLLSSPNIFAGMDLHNGSSAVFRPGTLPRENYDLEDFELMNKTGKIYSHITGFPYLASGYRFEDDPLIPRYAGTSGDFAYLLMGISFHTLELGNGFIQMGNNTLDMVMTKDFYKNNEKYVCDLMKYHDERESEFFYPWTEFDHPQLGKVEIGGITTAYAYGISFPITGEVEEKSVKALIRHAKMGPKLSFENVYIHRIEEDLYRVSGALTNTGDMPANVMKVSKGRPMHSQVVLKCNIPNGGKIVNDYNEIYKDDLNPGEKYEFEWLIKLPKGYSFTITAEHKRCIPAKIVMKNI